MAREVKFRIWDRKENKFVRGYEYPFGNDNGIYIDPENGNICKISHGEDSFHVDEVNEINHNGDYYYDCSLQQYTNLKDKNGIDIYEGDILSYDYADGKEIKDWMLTPHFIVGYEKDYIICGVDIKPERKCYLHGFRFKHAQVLGNIHENYDLID